MILETSPGRDQARLSTTLLKAKQIPINDMYDTNNNENFDTYGAKNSKSM